MSRRVHDPLRALRDLSWRDRAEVVVIVAVAAVVEVGIRFMRLPRLAKMLGAELDTSPARGQRMTKPPPAWAVKRLDSAVACSAGGQEATPAYVGAW